MKTQLSKRDELRLKHAAELINDTLRTTWIDSYDGDGIMNREKLHEAVDLVQTVFAANGVETEIVSMSEEVTESQGPAHTQAPGSQAAKVARLHFDLFDDAGAPQGYVVAIDGKVCYAGIRDNNGPCERLSWTLGLDGKTFHSETKRRGWTYQKVE